MARPHVLIVVENLPFTDDTRVRKQVDTLLDAGFRVSVISPRSAANPPHRVRAGLRLFDYPAPPQGAGAFAYVVEYLYALLMSSVLAIRARITGRIDVVQLCAPPDVFLVVGWLLRLAGARVVVDQRDLLSELYSARYVNGPSLVPAFLRRLERASQRSADRVLVVNQTLADSAVRAGVAPGRLAIVRNGPVLAAVAGARPDPSLREGMRTLACWSGVMGRQDRLDLLIDSIADLVRTHERTDCLVALLGDGEAREEAREQVRSLGLERWVRFPGWVDEATLFRYLATSDLGLDSTLQREVSPVKAVEYMAFGMPFAAFDLPETRRTGGDAAVYAPPGDVEALAAGIEHLLSDDGERRVLGERARTQVERELAWDRQTNVYIASIARCADGADRAGATAR